MTAGVPTKLGSARVRRLRARLRRQRRRRCCARPGRSASARRRRRSSGCPATPRPTSARRRARRGTRPGWPAGRAAARRPRWPAGSSRSRRAATAAARSASRPACAGWSGSRPSRGRVSRGPLDLDCDPAVACSARWPAPSATPRRSSTPSRSRSRATPIRSPPLPAGETLPRLVRPRPGRLRIGRFLDSPIPAEVDPQVRAAWEQASALLGRLGHEVVDVARADAARGGPAVRDGVGGVGRVRADPARRGATAASADPAPARARPGGQRRRSSPPRSAR